MSGVPVNLLARTTFDDPAEVHDRHPVAHVLDDAEVVRDEEQRESEPPLQVLQEIEDLGLDGDIQRRHGLVGDDETRPDGERAGDADPLALPAAELVRMAVARVGWQADELEQLLDARAPLAARADPVDGEPLAHDAGDAYARIERAVGVLEDDLHLAAHGPQLPRRERKQRTPVEQDVARG